MLNKIKAVLLSNRFKSFYWRLGMLVLAALIGGILDNINILSPYLSPASIGILGLILGEISKAVNNSVKARKLIK